VLEVTKYFLAYPIDSMSFSEKRLMLGREGQGKVRAIALRGAANVRHGLKNTLEELFEPGNGAELQARGDRQHDGPRQTGAVPQRRQPLIEQVEQCGGVSIPDPPLIDPITDIVSSIVINDQLTK
jgi:hypothetical protein